MAKVSLVAPLFFLSYARSESSAGADGPATDVRVRQFFDTLSRHIIELVGLPPGLDPGYLDLSCDGSENWRAGLLRAVGTSQSFLSLLSPRYVRCGWCAMEWDAFSRRIIVSRDTPRYAGGQTAILPVLWTPLDKRPAAIQRVQSYSPQEIGDRQITELYQREGLYGLLALGMGDIFEAIAWDIAQHLVRLCRSYTVLPQVLSGTDRLRKTFADEGGGGR